MNQDTQNTGQTDAQTHTMPVRRLAMMNQLAELGFDGVADRLTELRPEMRVEAEHAWSGFADRSALAAQFSDGERVGVLTRLPNGPGGYVAVVFPVGSANRAAAIMLRETTDDLTTIGQDMASSALKELGNMMASGFVDAWANRFDYEIDFSTPSLVRGSETEIISRTLNAEPALGLYIASTVRLPEYDITSTVYLFPETDAFLNAVETIDANLSTL
jgi:chemotaxis protein CheC